MARAINIIPSEDDVIWAFLSWLNKAIHADFCVKYRPDKVKGGNKKKEIDYIAEDRITGKQIAIEESSFWKNEQSGKEAADWTYSVDYIKQKLSGKVKGQFDISTPISFSLLKNDRDDFSENLLAKLDLLVIGLENSKIQINGENWYKLTNTGLEPVHSQFLFAEDELPGKLFLVKIDKINLKVNYYNKYGSNVEFIIIRQWDDDDRKLFLANMTRIIKKREVKLKPYKNRGLETWLVIYSTLWTTTNVRDIQTIMKRIPELYFTAVDHLVLVSGNPPDDAILNELKIPGRNH